MSNEENGAMQTACVRTSEGCHRVCMLCGMGASPPRAVARSPESVVAEVRAHAGEAVILQDCCMAGGPAQTEAVLHALCAAEGIAGRCRFEAAFRPDRLTEGVAEALRELNVSAVMLYCMAGSEREVAEFSGGRMTFADAERALLTCRKFSLPVHALLFKGSPDARRQEVSETYEWVIQAAKRRLLHAATVELLLPLPGTRYFDEALARGAVAPATTVEEIRQHWPRYYLPRNLPQEELLCYDLLMEPINTLLEQGRKRTACVLAAGEAATARSRVERLARNTYFDEVVSAGEGRGEVPLLQELVGRGAEVIYWLSGDERSEDAAQALAWEHLLSGADSTTWLDDAEGKAGILLSPRAVRALGDSPQAQEGRLSVQWLSELKLGMRRCAADRSVLLGRPLAERLLHVRMAREWGLKPAAPLFAAAAQTGAADAGDAAAEGIRLRDMLIRAQQGELLRLAAETRRLKKEGKDS